MKKLKKFLPIEFYFLLLPALLLFLLSVIYLKSLSVNVFGIGEFLKDSFGINSPFSTSLLVLLLMLLLLLLIPSFSFLFKVIFLFLRKRKIKEIEINWKHILNIFLIISLVSFVSYSLTLFTSLLFKIANPAKTAQVSNIALSLDKTIFKADPGIWMINKFGGTFAEKILLLSYNSIFLILSAILLASFVFNKKAFKKLILSFFISWMIALPIWFLLPVIPPDFMFRLNKLNAADLQETAIFNSIHPSEQLKENLTFQEKIHIINTGSADRFLPISTFPSMHAAWGVVIAYAGIALCPLLAIVLIPWAILNGVGAVYILEHFSVDIFLGIAVAIIAIIITEILINLENKYFEDRLGLFAESDHIQKFFKKFWLKLQKIVK